MYKKIDKRNSAEFKSEFESRLQQVESSLKPLIDQITTPNVNAGKSPSLSFLIKYLSESIEAFLSSSTQILNENSSSLKEFNLGEELDTFRLKSNQMIQVAANFAKEPASSEKRIIVIQRARELLCYVARVLTLADLVDSKQLHILIDRLKSNLNAMKNTSSQDELLTYFKAYGVNFKELMLLTKKALTNIKDSNLINELIAHRSFLTKQNLFLYTSSKTVIQHHKNDMAKSLRENVFSETLESIEQIYSILKICSSTVNHSEQIKSIKQTIVYPSSSLLSSLDDLDNQIREMNSTIFYKEIRTKTNLQNQLDETLNNITKISFENTSSERKNRLYEECDAVRKALVDLFNSYGTKNEDDNLVEKKKETFLKKTRSIRRQLRKAIAEKFSVHLKNQPIDQLINAALTGDQKILEDQIHFFTSHVTKLVESSQLACSMSNDKQGVQMVHLAIRQIQSLLPQILYSARLLCSYPVSTDTNKNMLAYKDTWLNEVELLLLAVDDILSINEFLAVSENLILDEINMAIEAMQNQDAAKFKYLCEQINGRILRVCELARYEMENYLPCSFTQHIISLCTLVRTKLVPNFAQSVELVHEVLKAKSPTDQDENDFIDASRLIYDGVRDIRNALLLIPNEGSSDEDDEDNLVEVKDEPIEVVVEPPVKENLEQKPELNEHQQEQVKPILIDENITEEQREHLNQQFDSFAKEKTNFDREVLKWDDKSNDIVVLAKKMCVIIMDMTDFMRGKGPFKTTIDIINAAKQISALGFNLEKLVKELADECPESQSKRELLGYLKQLPLFCNQLNIASKVKENIIDPDSASSLIISSKNLMTAVISVVQSSYVASTKYTSKTGNKRPIVQWKMKPPEKKPLVNVSTKINEPTGLIRKGSVMKKVEPVKILSEFQV